MKQEPFFIRNGNSILDRNGRIVSFRFVANPNEAKPQECVFFPIKWSDIEFEESSFNEELLANLRTTFKSFEEKGVWLILQPLWQEPLWAQKETFSLIDKMTHFIECTKHLTRRVKDCKSIIGIEAPAEVSTEAFQSDFFTGISKKHSHYLFFAKEVKTENFLPLSVLKN